MEGKKLVAIISDAASTGKSISEHTASLSVMCKLQSVIRLYVYKLCLHCPVYFNPKICNSKTSSIFISKPDKK